MAIGLSQDFSKGVRLVARIDSLGKGYRKSAFIHTYCQGVR
jgi:hypothetical protein